MQGLFITATDTGAGKTFFTAALARLWRQQGRKFAVCKPVATGGPREEGDPALLAQAAEERDLQAITPFCFQVAAAPPVAARACGEVMSLEQLILMVRRRYQPGRKLLVEGVGGLLCPLTERETVADLALALQLPVVIVARRSLGTLNHTLLTVEAAKSRRLPLAGVVVSETQPARGLAEESNVSELRCRLDVPILAVLPYHAAKHPPAVGSLAAVDWWSLAEGRIQHGNRM